MYASSYLTEEEKQKALQQGANTSGIVGGTTASGGAVGAAAGTEKDPGTGFLNLSQYLDANKGAGAQLANDASKTVSTAADAYSTDASKLVQTAQDKFKEASKDTQAASINSGVKADASAIHDTAKDFLGAGYSGPKAVDYTTGLAADKARLQASLEKVDDQDTLQSNLKTAYGKNGRYTDGFSVLDSFLARGDKSGQDALKAVKDKGTTVGNVYDTTAGTLGQAELTAKGKLDANKASIVDTAKASRTGLENVGKAKVENLNNTLDPDKIETSKASLGDVYTDDDYADLLALSDLANLDKDSSWYDKTHNAGKVRPGGTSQPNTQTTAERTAEINKTLGNSGPGEVVKKDRSQTAQQKSKVVLDENGNAVLDEDGNMIYKGQDPIQNKYGDDANIITTKTTAPGMSIPTGTALPNTEELSQGISKQIARYDPLPNRTTSGAAQRGRELRGDDEDDDSGYIPAGTSVKGPIHVDVRDTGIETSNIGGGLGLSTDTGETPEQKAQRIAEFQAEKEAKAAAEKARISEQEREESRQHRAEQAEQERLTEIERQAEYNRYGGKWNSRESFQWNYSRGRRR